MIEFFKYHGTGNDFILIDDRISRAELPGEKIRKLCNRHFGIGADGLIQIREHPHVDFEMIYYNSDGLQGSMCGNGGRCAVAFAYSLGIAKKEAFFIAFDGRHSAKINTVDPFDISLKMNDVSNIELHNEFIFLNTGSPHYVKFVEDADSINIVEEGRKIRYSDRFKDGGTNVNFVQLKRDSLYIRTYERGVEDETLSCGTGVTASVIASAFAGKIAGKVCRVETPGGQLRVRYEKKEDEFQNVYLEGPAEMVFKGQW
jgi:diaminopimelate epimerase